ncbi:hypothetical protein U9M48_031629 [Paspalum notatum var. saurae]|uniref:Protein FAR1-RELATED SEQUENCE n=1 Tax=Paspalum notatum var. saurae TaxID=547442 RepID=A0AAQ3U3I0_PASNO
MAKGNIVIAQGLFPITVEAGRGSISRVRNVSPCPGPDEATTETEAGAHRCGYPHGGVRLLQRPPPTTPCASSSDLPHDRGSPSPHGVVRPPLHPRSPASDCGGAIAHPSLGWGVVRHGQEGMAKLSAEPMLEYYDIVSKVFSSEEEGFQFYNRYALEKGFSVHKAYVEWDKGNEEICLRSLVCSREGFREAKYMNREERKRKPRNLSRVGCKAKLVIAKVDESGQWFVKDFIDEHNHPLAPKDLSCLLRSHRRISDEQKAEIVEMEIAGIRKHQIMDKLEIQYGGYDNVGFTSRDIYNFCYQYKQEMIDGGDAEAVISHFKAIQQRDPEFFFKYLVDGEGHLKGLFWADSQSRIDYKAFGDVVVFDSTYRTNRYNMPFVPFVGLNHHRSTVIFGCGIISHETSEAYEWMLWTFLLAMAQKHPISVITDGDLAMQRALRVVWPNCNHRLCVWHIGQNVIRNLHDEALKEDFKAFIFDCSSVEELERKWDKFLEKFEVNSESWLYQMYKMRKLWCAAYHVGHCFLGLTSNQRSESLNSRLHAHLDGKMTLIGMVQHYDQCLSDFRRKEANEDIVALQTVPFTEAYASAIEKDAARLFTPNVFAQVKFSIDAANNCIVSDVLDGCDIATYMVAKMDRREIRYNVTCEFKSDALFGISCSCRKLECFGTPSSFGNTKQESLSLSRWKTYMGERVIDAYAYLCDLETCSRSVLTTIQSQWLIQHAGAIPRGCGNQWVAAIATKCVGRNMVYIPLNTYNMHWMLLVLNVKKKEIQVLNSIPDPIFRDETKEALLEADYLTNNSENNTAEESNADDDIQEISMQVAAKKNNQSTKAKRKRGRPRKVKSALDSTKEKFSTKTIEKQVQSTVAKDRHGIKRRAVIPGPHQKSPYKPF